MAIEYLNTDLDLSDAVDLGPLASAFEAHGMCTLHINRGNDGLRRATFETARQHEEPEATISEMLAVVEGLQAPLLKDWRACMLREYNIGYDCGAEPWGFNHGLSTQLLRRLADAGATLRITLYPPGTLRPPCP
jgi:hypothetical protein